MGAAAEEAKRYLQQKEIPAIFESLMTGLMYNRPTDPVDFMLASLLRIREKNLKVTWETFVDNPPPPFDTLIEGGVKRPQSVATATVNNQETFVAAEEKSISDAVVEEVVESTPVKPMSSVKRSSRPPTAQKTKTPSPPKEAKKSSAVLNSRNVTIPDVPVVLLIGGPGGAKGRHARGLQDTFKDENLVHIGAPDLLRTAIAKYEDKYPEWKEASEQFDKGELVSNELMMALVKYQMAQSPDAKMFVVEGYPRSLSQVQEFEREVRPVDLAIILDYDEETLKEQMQAGGQLDGVIDKRLAVFKSKTLPAAKYYDDKYILHLIPGEQGDEAIQHEMKDLLLPLLQPNKAADSAIADVVAEENAAVVTEVEPEAQAVEASQPDNVEETVEKPVATDSSTVEKPVTNGWAKEAPVILVVGAPGSLKSQYCERIVKRYEGFLHISMGSLLRSGIAANTDERWGQIKMNVEGGDLAPLDICKELIVKTLKEYPKSWGYVIEGYPRTVEQAVDFEAVVERIDLVLLIDCTEQFCITSIRNRTENPDVTQRMDDRQESVKQRISQFKLNTLPMLKYFDEKGKLKVVEGDKGVDVVFPEVVNNIDTCLFIPADSSSGKSLDSSKNS